MSTCWTMHLHLRYRLRPIHCLFSRLRYFDTYPKTLRKHSWTPPTFCAHPGSRGDKGLTPAGKYGGQGQKGFATERKGGSQGESVGTCCSFCCCSCGCCCCCCCCPALHPSLDVDARRLPPLPVFTHSEVESAHGEGDYIALVLVT